MKILFTICARAGSKGFANKNLMTFNEHPLALYTVSVIDLFLKENQDIEADIALNTDSQALIDLFDNEVVLPYTLVKRSEALAGDFSAKIAVIAETYKTMREQGSDYDMVVDLDVTSPLRTAKDVKALIFEMDKSRVDVVFSVTESRRNPYFNMVKETPEGFVRAITSNFNTRQEAPEFYDMNASLYAYKPAFLETGKNIFEGTCQAITMKDTGVLDIDSQADAALMQAIASHLYQTEAEFKAVQTNISKIKKNALTD